MHIGEDDMVHIKHLYYINALGDNQKFPLKVSLSSLRSKNSGFDRESKKHVTPRSNCLNKVLNVGARL